MRRLLLLLLVVTVGCATTAPDLVYVTPAFGEGIAAVRVDTLEVKWWRGPRGPVRSGRPMHMALKDGKLWVGDLDGPGVVALDAQTGETVHSLKLPHEVVGIAISPDGERLITAARDALEAYVVDVKKGVLRGTAITGEIAPVDSLPAFFTGHPYFPDWREHADKREFAFVQDNVHGLLLDVDTVVPNVLAVGNMGSVHCIERRPEHGLIYVCEGTLGRRPGLLVSDSATHGKDPFIPVPLDADETPRLHHGCFSKDFRFYYVANMGPLKAKERQGRTVAMVDLEKHEVVKTVRAGRGAGHPILSPDGKTLYVVNHSETFVSVFDAATLDPRGEIEVARTPAFGHGVVFTKDGALLVLASTDHELVKIVDGKVVARLDLGAELGELEPGW